MIPVLPINLMPIVYGVLAAGILAGAYWVVDKIGDEREQKVWRQINRAIEKINVDVRRFNDADAKIAAVAEAARQKALDEASQISAPNCKATEQQAKTLSRIK